MASSNIPMKQLLSPIQIYRHLLRECSYLPPAFRSKIEGRIKDRFHRHVYDTRAERHIRGAYSVLRLLRAANHGEQAAMTKLIQQGFGREGFRRRKIMSDFVRPQGADNTQSLEESISSTMENENRSIVPSGKKRKPPKNSFFLRWDQSKLRQFLESQRTQEKATHQSTSWRASIRSLDSDQYVPRKTIWGTPPADRLVQSKRARWWRSNAEKIMPPLGRGEWELLGKLAGGAQETDEWKVPSRRQPANAVIEDSNDVQHVLALLDYAKAKVSTVERHSKPNQVRFSGRKDCGPYTRGQEDRTLSPRWFKRAYNRTWQTTPTMTQDPNTLKYSFTWGVVTPKMPEATAQQRAVFDGVDRRGTGQSTTD